MQRITLNCKENRREKNSFKWILEEKNLGKIVIQFMSFKGRAEKSEQINDLSKKVKIND